MGKDGMTAPAARRRNQFINAVIDDYAAEPTVVANAVVAANPGQRRWQRIPLCLHVRAVKP